MFCVHTSRSLNDGGSGGGGRGGRSCGHAEAVLAVLVGAQRPLLLRLRLDVQRRPVPWQPAPARVAAAASVARLKTRNSLHELTNKSGASNAGGKRRRNAGQPRIRIVLVALLCPSVSVYLLLAQKRLKVCEAEWPLMWFWTGTQGQLQFCEALSYAAH